jgi:hypothetical protein
MAKQPEDRYEHAGDLGRAALAAAGIHSGRAAVVARLSQNRLQLGCLVMIIAS